MKTMLAPIKLAAFSFLNPLGPKTAALAAEISEYNPCASWSKVTD
jgi:hypothetical protein